MYDFFLAMVIICFLRLEFSIFPHSLSTQHFQRYPSYDPHTLQQQSKDLDVKMQEFQYETASVRAQLTEAASASKMELDQLTRKLAETELDAERNKVAFHEEMSRYKSIADETRKKLSDKQGDYDELKLKYKAKEKVRGHIIMHHFRYSPDKMLHFS